MIFMVRLKEEVCGTTGYVDFEKIDETVRYLNTFLESSGRMDLGQYKSIVNRKLKFDIPSDPQRDSIMGFMPNEKYGTFYSEITSWYDDNGKETEVTGRLKYRSIYQKDVIRERRLSMEEEQ